MKKSAFFMEFIDRLCQSILMVTALGDNHLASIYNCEPRAYFNVSNTMKKGEKTEEGEETLSEEIKDSGQPNRQ